jgi:hypothetical protein
MAGILKIGLSRGRQWSSRICTGGERGVPFPRKAISVPKGIESFIRKFQSVFPPATAVKVYDASTCFQEQGRIIVEWLPHEKEARAVVEKAVNADRKLVAAMKKFASGAKCPIVDFYVEPDGTIGDIQATELA